MSLHEKIVAERRAVGQDPIAQMRQDPPLLVAREPRAVVEDPVQLGAMLEGSDPPAALGAPEVEMVVGSPPDFETGEGGRMGFAGLRSFARERHLTYSRDDGRVLHYAYEGALAYALTDSSPVLPAKS